MAFSIVKYIHILSAITAVGLNISYTIWILPAQREPANTAFAHKGIKFLDDRIANPAYGVLLLTGLIMVFMQWRITDLWIILALILFAAVGGVGGAFYPAPLKNPIKLGGEGRAGAAEDARVAGAGR